MDSTWRRALCRNWNFCPFQLRQRAPLPPAVRFAATLGPAVSAAAPRRGSPGSRRLGGRLAGPGGMSRPAPQVSCNVRAGPTPMSFRGRALSGDGPTRLRSGCRFRSSTGELSSVKLTAGLRTCPPYSPGSLLGPDRASGGRPCILRRRTGLRWALRSW